MDPRALDRRDFLRATAVSATGLVVGAGLADCGSPVPVPSRPTVAPATPPQWTRFAETLTGRLVRPGDAAYAVGHQLYNPKFDSLRPVAIAYCASGDDVARSLGFARAHGYEIAARAGGQSYGGYSSGTGRLVIDVSPMHAVTPAAQPGGFAHVAAGARLIDVYNALGAVGQLVPGGSCPTVGIAGLTLGGGVGVFARRFGLASDNLAALQVVTADGSTVACSTADDTDLYWACRGGGGGNFGIVTSFAFQTHPMPEVTLFTYDFPWGAAAEVLGSWQRWTARVNPAVWSNCQLLSGDGTYLRVAGVSCASPSQTSAWLAPLLGAVGTAPTDAFIGGEAYVRAMMVEGGCADLTVAACHLDTTGPHGVLSRQAFSASSNYVAAPMGAARLAAAVAAVETLAAELPSLGGGLVFDALGGAVNEIAPSETAFAHRTFLASIQSSFNWTGTTPASQIAAGTGWLASVRRSVYDPATGAYQNYIDPTLPDWAAAYYGANLARLEQVKARVDPDRVFSFAQSIP